MAINLATHARDLQAKWNVMRIHVERIPEIDAVAKRLFASKKRFLGMTELTHVPWDVIAVIKEREAGPDTLWDRNIANGQRWDERTTEVPKGRGPFKSWDGAAYDALVNCPPHAAKWKDWSMGGTLCLLEQYNGLGYANMGVPSPYLWSFSDQYVRGKYTSDHGYDPNMVDKQMGCAPILARLFVLDPSIANGPSLNV